MDIANIMKRIAGSIRDVYEIITTNVEGIDANHVTDIDNAELIDFPSDIDQDKLDYLIVQQLFSKLPKEAKTEGFYTGKKDFGDGKVLYTVQSEEDGGTIYMGLWKIPVEQLKKYIDEQTKGKDQPGLTGSAALREFVNRVAIGRSNGLDAAINTASEFLRNKALDGKNLTADELDTIPGMDVIRANLDSMTVRDWGMLKSQDWASEGYDQRNIVLCENLAMILNHIAKEDIGEKAFENISSAMTLVHHSMEYIEKKMEQDEKMIRDWTGKTGSSNIDMPRVAMPIFEPGQEIQWLKDTWNPEKKKFDKTLLYGVVSRKVDDRKPYYIVQTDSGEVIVPVMNAGAMTKNLHALPDSKEGESMDSSSALREFVKRFSSEKYKKGDELWLPNWDGGSMAWFIEEKEVNGIPNYHVQFQQDYTDAWVPFTEVERYKPFVFNPEKKEPQFPEPEKTEQPVLPMKGVTMGKHLNINKKAWDDDYHEPLNTDKINQLVSDLGGPEEAAKAIMMLLQNQNDREAGMSNVMEKAKELLLALGAGAFAVGMAGGVAINEYEQASSHAIASRLESSNDPILKEVGRFLRDITTPQYEIDKAKNIEHDQVNDMQKKQSLSEMVHREADSRKLLKNMKPMEHTQWDENVSGLPKSEVLQNYISENVTDDKLFNILKSAYDNLPPNHTRGNNHKAISSLTERIKNGFDSACKNARPPCKDDMDDQTVYDTILKAISDIWHSHLSDSESGPDEGQGGGNAGAPVPVSPKPVSVEDSKINVEQSLRNMVNRKASFYGGFGEEKDAIKLFAEKQVFEVSFYSKKWGEHESFQCDSREEAEELKKKVLESGDARNNEVIIS